MVSDVVFRGLGVRGFNCLGLGVSPLGFSGSMGLGVRG